MRCRTFNQPHASANARPANNSIGPFLGGMDFLRMAGVFGERNRHASSHESGADLCTAVCTLHAGARTIWMHRTSHARQGRLEMVRRLLAMNRRTSPQLLS